jgi:hypothetical protein
MDSFATDDSFSSGNSFRNISSYEANLFFAGLYRIPDTWASEGTPSGRSTAAYLTSTDLGVSSVNTRNRNVLQFTVPNYSGIIRVSLTEGTVSLSSIVSELNADSIFSKYLVASNPTATTIRITTKAIGVSSDLDLTNSNAAHSAASLLGLVNGTKTDGVGTSATVTVKVVGPTGQGIYGSTQIFTLKTLAAEGENSTAFKFQAMNPRKGTVVSGDYTNSITVKSGDDGDIELEVVAAGAVEEQCHMEVSLPATHAWAIVPESRLEIVGAQN